MPKRSNEWKREWSFFLNEYGRREYNDQCRRCVRDCKQSYRADLVQCRNFLSKRSKAGKKYKQAGAAHECRKPAHRPLCGLAKGIYHAWIRGRLHGQNNRKN